MSARPGSGDWAGQTATAAAAAVALHTTLAGIDDDGKPVEVGAWHLVVSLRTLGEAAGTPFGPIAQDALAFEDADITAVGVDAVAALEAGAAAASLGTRAVEALRGLLRWADHLGGWEAPCWEQARRVAGSAVPADEDKTAPRPADALDVACASQGWDDRSKAALLLRYVTDEARYDPGAAARFARFVEEQVAFEDCGRADTGDADPDKG